MPFPLLYKGNNMHQSFVCMTATEDSKEERERRLAAGVNRRGKGRESLPLYVCQQRKERWKSCMDSSRLGRVAVGSSSFVARLTTRSTRHGRSPAVVGGVALRGFRCYAIDSEGGIFEVFPKCHLLLAPAVI